MPTLFISQEVAVYFFFDARLLGDYVSRQGARIIGHIKVFVIGDIELAPAARLMPQRHARRSNGRFLLVLPMRALLMAFAPSWPPESIRLHISKVT